MFTNLTKFSYQRSTKEAVGFYIAYLVLIMLSGGILAGILGFLISPTGNSFEFGMRIGGIVAIIFSLGISFLILKEKKLLNSFKFILILLLSGLFAILLGGIGGLIPAAYLTTRPSK